MSCAIGPNGFHDGEPPSEDDYDEDALSKLCDNPAYLVVGADDDLTGNLPGWVEDLLTEHESLAKQVELLGLDPSRYVSLPDRKSNHELREFLGELGFTVDSGYVERGPLSSIDGVVYVRLSKVPALEKRAARELVKAKRAIIKDARRALKPSRVTAAGLEEELERLVSVAQLGDPEYREKLTKLAEFEETEAELLEHHKELVASVSYWRGRAEKAEREVAAAPTRNLEWAEAGVALSERYARWTWVVAAEFGITIQGPLLKLADGRAFAIEAIFGKDLAKDNPTTWEAIRRREPGAKWIRVESSIRRGMSSVGPLSWHEAVRFFDRRLTWHQVWWVVLGRSCARHSARLFQRETRYKPDGGYDGYADIPVLPDDALGLTAEQTARWEQLLKEYWGKGIESTVWNQ
jgi:hypothetical protein